MLYIKYIYSRTYKHTYKVEIYLYIYGGNIGTYIICDVNLPHRFGIENKTKFDM